MGRIAIDQLKKTYLNRRKVPRGDDDQELHKGDEVTVFENINLNIIDGEMAVSYTHLRAHET